MHKKLLSLSIFFLLIFFCSKSFAQERNDTLILKADSVSTKKFDSSSKKNILSLDTSAKKFNPRVATFRSAVLPGWGQAYNKKYWKIPIVYGALGTTAYIFFQNLKTYKLLKQAVIYRSDTSIHDPNALIDPRFRNLTTESIRRNRNIYRQNIDYSVLFFIVFWGLNVADATVDAHLKAFDVSDNISFRIKLGHSDIANTTGLSFVFAVKDKHAKVLSSFK